MQEVVTGPGEARDAVTQAMLCTPAICKQAPMAFRFQGALHLFPSLLHYLVPLGLLLQFILLCMASTLSILKCPVVLALLLT